MKKKKRRILIGTAVVLSGVIGGNLTVSGDSEEKNLIFSNIEALAQTETSNPPTECKYSGYICVGWKDGRYGNYVGLSLIEEQ